MPLLDFAFHRRTFAMERITEPRAGCGLTEFAGAGTQHFVADWPVASFRQHVEFSRYRAHSRHGPTCCGLDPVANDPFRTPANSKRSMRVVRLGEVWWYESLMV